MAAEGACGGELAQLVADHILSDVDGDELVAVVHCECVAYEIGEMMEARLQVLMTDFLADSSMAATFFSSLTLMKGPFFNERLITAYLSNYFFLLSMMYLLECFLGERVFRPLA